MRRAEKRKRGKKRKNIFRCTTSLYGWSRCNSAFAVAAHRPTALSGAFSPACAKPVRLAPAATPATSRAFALAGKKAQILGSVDNARRDRSDSEAFSQCTACIQLYSGLLASSCVSNRLSSMTKIGVHVNTEKSLGSAYLDFTFVWTY